MEGAPRNWDIRRREAEMLKLYSMIAVAALIAGALVVAPSLREVSASTRTDITQTTGGKGDRLDVAARLACRQQSWPYLENSCIRDVRTESGSGRKVRLVTAGRK
jgi:hypothetical protein